MVSWHVLSIFVEGIGPRYRLLCENGVANDGLWHLGPELSTYVVRPAELETILVYTPQKRSTNLPFRCVCNGNSHSRFEI